MVRCLKIEISYKTLKKCDKFLWFLIFMISLYGFLLVSSATRTGSRFFESQIISVLIGIPLAFISQFIDYRNLSRYWILISVFCAGLMIYTLIFGSRVKGLAGVDAKAWIVLPGGFNFQSSELAKIGFLFSFAKHLEILKKNNNINNIKSLIFFGIHAIIPIILTHLQGDDGAAIIFICIILCQLFIAGLDAKFFLIGLALFAASMPVIWNFFLAPYQKNRILSMMNPESDPYGMGFQQLQGKISIGSGGFLGSGLFKGIRVEQGDVPVQASDFIFSVAGEELGFVGCFLIIILLLALIFRIFFISKFSKDYLGIFICFGFIGLITSQCIFNLGMCLSFLPVIGVILPFFSAGGSSVICYYLAIGLIQSIYISRNKN